MPYIRFPKTGESSLKLCRAQIGAKEPIFNTYAEMITFAASVGFFFVTRCDDRLRDDVEFLKSPNPIDFSVFKNDNSRLYPQILTIALATSGTLDSVSREEGLCELIERYAALGFTKMNEYPLCELMLMTLSDNPKDDLKI